MDSIAKGKDYHSEMAHARRSDGINVIFDKNSPSSSGSRSGSSTACDSDRSPDSGHSRRRHRSSSSSSSSRSSTSDRPRSRSHPRCHRRSSRCHCDGHLKRGSGKPRSPSRRYKEKSRSHSRATLPDRYSHRRRNRSRSGSRSPRRSSRPASKSIRTHRSQSRSSESSISLSLHDKKELLNAAKANAMKFLGVEKLDLPESVKPILSESRQLQPETTVTHLYTKTFSQNNEEEPDYVPSPKFSLKGKISFSINNSVVKPTVIPPSCAKVTPRMDSYESRKPYGHWVPVKSGRTSKARKHSSAMSH